jgi:hypothetical protein
VFDPQRMTWLKLDARALAADPALMAGGGAAAAALAAAAAAASGAGPGSISVEEEDDPFAGFDELVDERAAAVAVGAGGARALDGEGRGGAEADWIVGEEFDLGPAFVRRQRGEEAEWRRRVERWMGWREGMGEEWKWEIRRVAERFRGPV